MDDDPSGSLSSAPASPLGNAAPAQAPLPGDLERTPLPERVVPYWQLTSAITWAFVVVVPVGIAVAVPGLPTVARIALVVLPLLLAAFDVFVVQPKRRSIWWYAIGDEQIDLQHGWPIVTRTVVPVTRVQHVSLEQGPISRRFTLAHLTIHTAAGVVKIPALDDAEGHRIRQRIADLARIADDL